MPFVGVVPIMIRTVPLGKQLGAFGLQPAAAVGATVTLNVIEVPYWPLPVAGTDCEAVLCVGVSTAPIPVSVMLAPPPAEAGVDAPAVKVSEKVPAEVGLNWACKVQLAVGASDSPPTHPPEEGEVRVN